jgi:hypothetical protein
VIDDKIYAIGGFNCFTPLSEVEYYDEESNKWFQASDMSGERAGLSACVITGFIRKHGGRGDRANSKHLGSFCVI